MRSADEIIKVSGGRLVSGNEGTEFLRVVTDSREVAPGDCFLCLKGEKADGSEYIPEALGRGASVVVTERNVPLCGKSGLEGGTTGKEERNEENGDAETLGAYSPGSGDRRSCAFPECAVIRTENAAETLRALAGYYRKKELTAVAAITGSVGKTTVKEMLSLIISERERVRKTDGNRNNLLGLPLSVLGGTAEKTGVFELGISEKGEMERLARIAAPDIAVVTGIGKTHLGSFGTLEETATQKLKIRDTLSPDGWLLLDGDSPLLRRKAEGDRRALFVSAERKDADIRAEDIILRDGYSVFDMYFAGIKAITALRVPLTGMFGVKDALFAAGAAFLMNASFDDIRSGIAKYKPDGMRHTVENTGDAVLYSDCYNASPEAFAASLGALKTILRERKNGGLYVVAGSMLELGEISEEEHLGVGRGIAELSPELLVTVGKEAEKIAAGAANAGVPGERIVSFAEGENEKVKEFLSGIISKHPASGPSGTRSVKTAGSGVYFVKGSRRLKLEEISAHLKKILSER